MAVPSTEQLNDFISTNFSNSLLWVGGQRKNGSSDFEWVDGSSFNFTNWAPGEPSNETNENCLLTNFGKAKHWNDEICDGTKPFFSFASFVCQYELKGKAI